MKRYRATEPYGILVDSKGETVYCQNPHCDNEAFCEVQVSVNRAGDETRALCAVCEEMFSTGVQHGRFLEAAILGCSPDFSRDVTRQDKTA